MKRIFIWAVIVLSALGASAQNANRSGIILELSGGWVSNGPKIGYYSGLGYYGYSSPSKAISDMNIRTLSGFVISTDLGYRLACSRHWAVDLRLKYEGRKDYSALGPMLGARVFTSDFGNMSLYFSGAIGFMGFFGEDFLMNYPLRSYLYYDYDSKKEYYYYYLEPDFWSNQVAFTYELGVGLNFSRMFYGGFNWNGKQLSDGDKKHHFGIFSFKLGFRIW